VHGISRDRIVVTSMYRVVDVAPCVARSNTQRLSHPTHAAEGHLRTGVACLHARQSAGGVGGESGAARERAAGSPVVIALVILL